MVDKQEKDENKGGRRSHQNTIEGRRKQKGTGKKGAVDWVGKHIEGDTVKEGGCWWAGGGQCTSWRGTRTLDGCMAGYDCVTAYDCMTV